MSYVFREDALAAVTSQLTFASIDIRRADPPRPVPQGPLGPLETTGAGGSTITTTSGLLQGGGDPSRLDMVAMNSAAAAPGGTLGLSVFVPGLSSDTWRVVVALGHLGGAGLSVPGFAGKLGLDPSTLHVLPTIGIASFAGVGDLALPVPSGTPSLMVGAQAIAMNLTTGRTYFSNTACVFVD